MEADGAGEEGQQRQVPGDAAGAGQGFKRGYQEQQAAEDGKGKGHNAGGGGALLPCAKPSGEPPEGTYQERSQSGGEEGEGRAHQSCASRFISPIVCMAWLRLVWQ